MAYTTWDEVAGDGFKDIFLRIKKGEKTKVRPLGKPVCFKKYMFSYKGKWRTAVCLDEDSCPVAKKHNIFPQIRYAINVIDRRYNMIKILESSLKVFQSIELFFKKTGKNPGGTDGAHFNLVYEDFGNKSSYSMQFAGPHTLEEDDISLIKVQGLHPLKEIYKAVDPSRIESILFKDIEGWKA